MVDRTGIADELSRLKDEVFATPVYSSMADGARDVLARFVIDNLPQIEAALRQSHSPDRDAGEGMRETAWRTLDDCPDDGRPIWIVGGRHDEPFRTTADGGWWRYARKEGSRAPPTHWHPDIVLPPAPLPLSQEGKPSC